MDGWLRLWMSSYKQVWVVWLTWCSNFWIAPSFLCEGILSCFVLLVYLWTTPSLVRSFRPLSSSRFGDDWIHLISICASSSPSFHFLLFSDPKVLCSFFLSLPLEISSSKLIESIFSWKESPTTDPFVSSSPSLLIRFSRQVFLFLSFSISSLYFIFLYPRRSWILSHLW